MDRTRENLEELLAARALGALTEAEGRDLEIALADDAELRAVAVEMDEAASMLAYATDPITPSAAVRERILGRARIRTATPREVGPTVTPARNVVDFPVLPARQRSGSFARLLAVAAVLLIATTTVLAFMMWRRSSRLSNELAQRDQQAQQLQKQLDHEREIREMLQSPDSGVVAMNGTPMSPTANAKFIYDRRTGHGMLMTDKLPMAPTGMTYQLWYIVKGKPMPGAMFKPDASGHAEMNTMVPMEGRDGAVLAITLEKDGGAEAPAGDIYLKSAAG